MFGWKDAPLLTPPIVGYESPAAEQVSKPKKIREIIAVPVYLKVADTKP
jgi:hypothetical protein